MIHRFIAIKYILITLVFLLFCLESNANTEYIDSLEKVLVNRVNDTTKVNVINQLSFEYHRIDPKKSQSFANDALKIANKIRFKKGKAKAYGNLGLYHAITDNYFKALDNYEKALRGYREIGDKHGVAKILANMGVVYQLQQDFNAALDLYLQALKMAESLGSTRQIANLLGNLGNLYEVQREFEISLEYYNKSLVLFKELDDHSQIGYLYGNIGLMYKNQSQYVKAIEYFNKSLTIDSLYGNKLAQSDNWANLGLTYSEIRDYSKAKECFQNALSIDEQLGNLGGIASDLAGLSNLYLAISTDSTKKTDVIDTYSPNRAHKIQYLKAALELGKKAERNYLEIGEPNYLIFKTLEEIYTEMGDLENALKYKELYWSNKTDVFSTDKAKEFARFEAKEERTKNLSKIAILESESSKNYVIIISITIISFLLFVIGIYFSYQLKQKRSINEKLEKMNSELKIAIDSKNKFFSILAHDLINPIGGMVTALRVFQKDRIEMSENDISEYLSVLVKTSESANNLLVNLLEWGRIQKKQIKFSPKSHNLNTILLTNIQLLQNVAKSKEIKINLLKSEGLSVEFDEYMINSVIGNLLSNAIKFTNKKGLIEIEVFVENEFAKVRIKDNGIGMDSKQKNNLFDLASHISTPGTNQEAGTGLGLILCKEFIDIHNGHITVDSTLNQGSTFTISLPLKQG